MKQSTLNKTRIAMQIALLGLATVNVCAAKSLTQPLPPVPRIAASTPSDKSWIASATYVAGDRVTRLGNTYIARWWNINTPPETNVCNPQDFEHTSGNPWEASNNRCGGGGGGGGVTSLPDPIADLPAPPAINPNPGAPVTRGTIHYHLLIGASPAQDSMTLTGDTYTGLIMSNIIAGVTYGHLIKEYLPDIQFNKDYLYGSILGQLLQENIQTSLYTSGSKLIAPSMLQQAVMGAGQGGPYQINNYAVDMVAGTYKPDGHALVNFVALQNYIGYPVTSGTQYTQPTPGAFNDIRFSPLLTAYFHYLDLVALHEVGKGPSGWQTPWQPTFDGALQNFKQLNNGFLDILLNVAYNQGFYGELMRPYSQLAADATDATVQQVNAYYSPLATSAWGSQDTYKQYPYQVRYYLDQLYGNPIPSGIGAWTGKKIMPDNHVAFYIPTLQYFFDQIFATLGYGTSKQNYKLITITQADHAFSAALRTNGVGANDTLDLSNAKDRTKIFAVLETAIGNLEKTIGMKFNATTTQQLAPVSVEK